MIENVIAKLCALETLLDQDGETGVCEARPRVLSIQEEIDTTLGPSQMSWMLPYRQLLGAMTVRCGPVMVDKPRLRNAAACARIIATCLKETSRNVLHLLFEHHQDLLPENLLGVILECMPGKLANTPLSRYLRVVRSYDDQHRTPKERQDWSVPLKAFLALDVPKAYPLLKFYILNYRFLACHNAVRLNLNEMYQEASSAAAALEQPEHFQAMGFVQYNWAILQKKSGDTALAMQHMTVAARSQKKYRLLVEGDKTAWPETLRSARTQEWKIREGWTKWFGTEMLDKCPISARDAAELVAKGIDRTFAA